VIGALNDSGRQVGQAVHVVSKQSSEMFAQFQHGAETVFEDFVDAGRRMGALLLRRISGEAPEDLHYLAKPKFNWED
jgi:LacI family transcriptional regulator